MGGMEINLHAFLNSAPDGGKWTVCGSAQDCVDATEKTKYFAHIGKKSRFLIAQNF
jgi:hypothetical protein